GFLQFVILPLYKELAALTSQEVGETCITRLEVNAEEWVKRPPSSELTAFIQGSPTLPRSTMHNLEAPFSPLPRMPLRIRKRELPSRQAAPPTLLPAPGGPSGGSSPGSPNRRPQFSAAPTIMCMEPPVD
ncbi:unnamed protein product, partial [Polarella glacialis]